MPSRSQNRDDAGIVVPLRSFASGKARLSAVLSEAGREALARSMAERVVAAAGNHPVVVVTSDRDVAVWARALGCDVVADPGSLDGSAAAGRDWAMARGIVRYAVVHADLPLAESFDAVVADGAEPVAVIVPDHRDDGNPVLTLPTAVPFTFAYGPGSAARHAAEARRRALSVHIVRDERLGFDVDLADDLVALEGRRPTPAQ
jgi:2-phospho-L-lactate/phosphoenolpyruvate guanylyltransferase